MGGLVDGEIESGSDFSGRLKTPNKYCKLLQSTAVKERDNEQHLLIVGASFHLGAPLQVNPLWFYTRYIIAPLTKRPFSAFGGGT